ncbi:MAG: beta-propeller domain-containing protein [Candidatus Gracilibacteria bacterium]|nr:beta-propeller domain-containing protein [Candidatus Gracilibacteria bacterium]
MNYKKLCSALVISLSAFSLASADDTDTQIIDAINKDEVKELNFDIKMKSFNSCEDMSKVMGDYLKNYYKNRPFYPYYRNGPLMLEKGMVMEDSVDASAEVKAEAPTSSIAGDGESDFSETNTQVSGVDEADIIKTDGKYIYYYKDTDKTVYVTDTKNTDLKLAKKIKLPEGFWGTQMYLADNKLSILANYYSNKPDTSYYFDRGTKTYMINYDVSDLENLKLEKIYTADGNLSKSRRIGDYLYVISTSNMYFPYGFDFAKADFKAEKFIPQKTEISLTENKEEQNLKVQGKTFPYKIKSGNSVGCNEIEYVLPSDESAKKFDFSPSFATVSIVDLKNPEAEVKSKVLVGDVSEIYMSTKNLYITNRMHTSYDFSCPRGSYCIMPYFRSGNNTLIHKINIDGQKANYQDSGIIPGEPLTQYSMDEKDDNFRIITKKWNPERSTGVYILDKNLKLKGSLTGLGKTEDFKSSRYVGDKLYLVTFKQIDPFFVIDLADASKPKVLGELKIPGYSTYLHPYDENHIIGLGYDTKENKWGGTVNNGLKIDLYDVSDFENPKQKHSLTLGQNGSYSEALNNPRMFMWNAAKNTLLLPATLYKNDDDDMYNRKDYFNGLVVVDINKDSGIKEKARITHIDTTGLEQMRKNDCSKYIKKEKEEPECRKLIDGTEYCKSLNYRYVPEYCYADSTLGEYMASRSWQFRDEFIKRALWIGDKYYSISDSYVQSNYFSNNKEADKLDIRNEDQKEKDEKRINPEEK